MRGLNVICKDDVNDRRIDRGNEEIERDRSEDSQGKRASSKETRGRRRAPPLTDVEQALSTRK